MSVLTITGKNFEDEVINSKRTVLIDFYADWCGPCKMMSPIIDEIAEGISKGDMGEKDIIVGKVNVDENQELAIKYNVMSIPTVIVFKEGKEAKTFVGLRDKQELINSLIVL